MPTAKPRFWKCLHGKVRRRILKTVLSVILLILTLPIVILFVRAYDARGLPDLQIWHRVKLEHEIRAADDRPDFTWTDYEVREDKLFSSLRERVEAKVPEEWREISRYVAGGPSDPARFDRNWNRSFELVPDQVRAGALLLHGLTDSPYSFRTIARILQKEGVHVLCLRMPGHGTAPSALRSVHWRDWVAAARIGARHVRETIGPDRPFFIGGYSNGGAVAVKYALDALEDGSITQPDRLFLFSPAIDVTVFARLADWHLLVSWMPYFEKFQWQSITPEFDPFKYSSFPKNAGYQIYRLISALHKQVGRLQDTGRLSNLPPLVTFQSTVDSTVNPRAVIEQLYAKLTANGSELVLFDVNRTAYLKNLLKGRGAEFEWPEPGQSYALTVVTNESPNSRRLVARTRPAGAAAFNSDQPLDLEWPTHIYSLSHVAIPIPPDDPVYGAHDTESRALDHFRFSRLELHGERGLLRIPTQDLLRLRYNPFFSYVEQRLIEYIRLDCAN